MYTQIILNLMLVVGLILIYMFIAWKIKGIKNSKNQLIEVVSVLGIGTKEKIMLLKVEGKKILVGATANSITVLSEIDALSTKGIDEKLSRSFSDNLKEASNKLEFEENAI